MNGIPLIDAYKKLPFKSYSGIDLVSNYIDITNKNIFNSIGNNHIATFNADASEYILDDNSYFNIVLQIVISKYFISLKF